LNLSFLIGCMTAP